MAQTLFLDLDEQTLVRAREAANAKGQTLEALVADVVRQLAHEDGHPGDVASRPNDPILGMFAGAPDLIDSILASAMASRERDPLRPAS